MIWIGLAAIILIGSFIYAVTTYLKTRKEVANIEPEMKLFVIQNPSAITSNLLQSFFNTASTKNIYLTFEIAVKNGTKALICHSTKTLATNFPDLKALEVENYLKALDLSKADAIEFEDVKEMQKPISPDFAKILFESIPLNIDDQIIYQVMVGKEQHTKSEELIANLRIVIISNNPERVQELKNLVTGFFTRNTNLKPTNNPTSKDQLMNMFLTRSFAENQGLSVFIDPEGLKNLIA